MSAHATSDLDLDANPFAQPDGSDPNPIPSPVVEAAERLKRAAGSNARRLREAATAGINTFRESTTEDSGEAAVPAPTWDELKDKAKALHKEGEAWGAREPDRSGCDRSGCGTRPRHAPEALALRDGSRAAGGHAPRVP